jgi:hypothetical protein
MMPPSVGGCRGSMSLASVPGLGGGLGAEAASARWPTGRARSARAGAPVHGREQVHWCLGQSRCTTCGVLSSNVGAADFSSLFLSAAAGEQGFSSPRLCT